MIQTVLDLRDPAIRESAGLRNHATVSTRSHAPVDFHRPKTETRDDIFLFVLREKTPVTRAQIAAHLGRKKTPHLIGILESLVDEGWLLRSENTLPNGMQVYFYRGTK